MANESESTRIDSSFLQPDDPEQRQIEDHFVLLKLFVLLRKQSTSVFLAAAGTAAILSLIAYDDTGSAWWALCGLPVLATLGVRAWAVGHHMPNPKEGQAVRRWFSRVVWSSMAAGSAHALFLAVFPYLSDTHRSLLTLLYLSLATAAVSSSAGHPRLFMTYTLPFVVPLALAWVFVPGQAYGMATGIGVGLLVLLFAYSMGHGYIGTAWKLFDESCRIRFRERELNQRLNNALDDARHAVQAKTRFLAAASHDLRQPLHVISLVTSTLKLRQLDTQSAEMVALLDRVSGSLNTQLNSLLDMSKLDAGLIQPQNQHIQVAAFLRQCFDTMAPSAHAKGLDPLLRIDTQASIYTDPALLQRMVNNVCQNAVKYTQQGRVVLAARDHGKRVVISVSDTGCGIPTEHQESVFQEFVQLGNPERDASQGLGLGLSIVRRMAQLLGVHIRLGSKPGAGTEISFTLPRAAGQTPDASPPPDSAPQVDIIHLGLTVLVLDDDASIRQACHMLLQALGCEPLLAPDLAQARRLASHTVPDVLLVDMRLTDGANGIDAVRNLRDLLGPVPAMLISGDTAPDRLAMAHQAGLRLFHKPLTLQQLLTELARIQNSGELLPRRAHAAQQAQATSSTSG